MENSIVRLREAKGWKQAELARRAGMDRQQLGRLESGKRKLTEDWARKIAPILGCTIEQLIFPHLLDAGKVVNIRPLGGIDGSEQSVSIGNAVIERMLPEIGERRLALVVAERDVRDVKRGNVAIVDVEAVQVATPGVYLVRVGGGNQLRYLSPSIDGTVQVVSDDPAIMNEVVKAGDIDLIGRVVMKLAVV